MTPQDKLVVAGILALIWLVLAVNLYQSYKDYREKKKFRIPLNKKLMSNIFTPVNLPSRKNHKKRYKLF